MVNLIRGFFGAHTYRRTCYSGDYTGQSIIKALLRKANLIGIKINDEEYVTDLLVDDKKCFGAISFNINNGEKTIHYADAVVLCTGGILDYGEIALQENSRTLGMDIF